MTGALQSLPLAQLRPSSTEAQVHRRARFDKGALKELADSVKSHGVLQPLVVRPIAANGKTPGHYEIVAGERRFVAAGIAKLERIPVNVLDLTDEQVVEIQLIENLQREDVHPMQEAEGYHELVTKYKHPIEDVYTRVGKSRSYVYGRMKLLALTPAGRKAFYDGKVNASIALKLARIPVPKLQDEALKAITRDDWSYREAAQIIERDYMLRLAEASFPVEDPDLAGAGPCGKCPKRTGNQPELFGDIKNADVCTDTVCFKAKAVAYGNRLAAEARARGQEVIDGKAAKRIVPNGIHKGHAYVAGGYVRADDEEFFGGKYQKISKLVGKDTPRTLVIDGESGHAIEVVPRSALPKETRGGSDYNPRTGRSKAADKKAELERKVKLAAYIATRAKLKAVDLLVVATALCDRLEHEVKKTLCKVRGFVPPSRTEQYRGKVTDYAAVGKGLAKLSAAELELFINDCIYARQLAFPNWSTPKEGTVLELAKRYRVDVAKIRRELAPKKKAAKKKAKK